MQGLLAIFETLNVTSAEEALGEINAFKRENRFWRSETQLKKMEIAKLQTQVENLKRVNMAMQLKLQRAGAYYQKEAEVLVRSQQAEKQEIAREAAAEKVHMFNYIYALEREVHTLRQKTGTDQHSSESSSDLLSRHQE